MASDFQDRIRKASRFDPRNIGVGGPVYTIQVTLLPNNNFRKGYDDINWKGNNHEKMPKMREEVQRP